MGLIVILENNKLFLIEKNEEVDITDKFASNKNVEYRDVNLKGLSLTMNEMMDKTIKKMGKKNFFDYTPLQYNCQNFTMNVLNANGLWNDEYKNFVFQPMDKLVKHIPNFIQSLSKGLINTKAYINKITGTAKRDEL